MTDLSVTAARRQAPVPQGGLFVDHVRKVYHTPHGNKPVLKDISFSMLAGDRLAIFGNNGAGKSTLVKLLGGVERPTAGRIQKTMSLSWPLAFSGGFENTLAGHDNIRFIARLYGQDPNGLREDVDAFAELGAHLRAPVETYSSGMRMRLAFGLTLAIPFDCLLIDEVTAVGDQRFQRKCTRALFEDKPERGLILVTHDLGLASHVCDQALILKNGYGAVLSDMSLATRICQSL